ncbi:MAG: hypothetical protein V1797_01875, partial [Pseudomonadota bacterium]
PAPPAPAPPSPPGAPQGRGCAWQLLRWLWALLGLALLLWLLAWLLPAGCSPLALLPGGMGGGAGGMGGGPGGPADARLAQLDRRGADLRAELDGLRAELQRRRQECEVRKAPPEPAPPLVAEVKPEPPAPVTTAPTTTLAKKAPPRPAPKPEPKPEPKVEPKPAPKPSEDLTVSKEDQAKKDVGFLKGQWESVTNLVEEGTDKPVTMELEIDEHGNGTATIVRDNGERCPAPMRSYFDDQGNLVFEDSQPHFCPSGGKFHPSQVICTVGPDGRATCRGRHPNGHAYDVVIKRR